MLLLRASLLVALLSTLTPLMTAVAASGQTRLASTYYVSPRGSDTHSGTEDEPWRTIEYSLGQLLPGDTLRVRAGTYDERVEPPRRLTSATAEAPIRVLAQAGERPVVRGRLYLSDPDHWLFEGIDITADSDAYTAEDNLLKIMNGTGWTFRGGEIWGARGTSAAVFIGSSELAEPSGWRFVGNCVHDTAPRDPEDGPNQDHNVYVSNGSTTGPGLIERNLMFGAPNGQNIKLGPPSPTTSGEGNVTVRHNTLHDAAQNVLLAWGAHDNVIEGNLMGRGSPAPGKDWYPNIRAHELTGEGNVARFNAGFESPQLIGYWDSSSHIDEQANHHPVTPELDATRDCSGLYPTNRAYRSYGAYAPMPTGDRIHRLAGTGRVETSVAVSEATFSSGSIDDVVIARGDTYPDALAGAPLAAALGAPILLAGGDRLHPEVVNEIDRIGADNAVLLGGPTAISHDIREQLEARGLTVQRIEGRNRFETAARIAGELTELSGTDLKNAYVVEGADPDPSRGWPDAVAVGFLAAQQVRPILLTTTETLPDATKGALRDLGVERATVVGGPAAVTEQVMRATERITGRVDRIGGDSRYHTSRLIADTAIRAGASPGRTWMATGAAFPDALTAGPAVAEDGGVLLLVPGHTTFLNSETTDWLDRYSGTIERLRITGGPAAVGYGIEDKSRHRLEFQ